MSSEVKKLSLWKKIFRFIIYVSTFFVVFITVLIVWHSRDLPDISVLEKTDRRPSVTLLSQDGELLATYGDLYGETLNLTDLPKHVYQAVVAVEDHRFFSHFGIDLVSFLRALFQNLLSRRVVQGGSSITQQLAKNFLLAHKKFHYSNRSIKRKIQEMLITIWLELRFTKNQILSIYLNRVDLGYGLYGFDAAAQKFFQKSIKDVSVFEAAMLAGMLKAPTRYNPVNHTQRSKDRAAYVVNKMLEQGFITKDEADLEKKLGQELRISQQSEMQGYKYFTDWVINTLPSYLGYIDRDIIVVTTIDVEAQKRATSLVKYYIQQFGKENAFSQVALVSMTPKGEVLAIVGGEDYAKSPFNRATQALRQPGSVFKSFVFLAAFERGLKLEDMYNDVQEEHNGYKPRNYGHIYFGDLTVAEAFAKSVNTITVKIARQYGIGNVIQAARRSGISTNLPRNLALALGAGEVTLFELTAAQAVMANDGFDVYPHGILEIRDKKTRSVLYKRGNPVEKRLFSEDVVRKMHHVMLKATQEGTGRQALQEGVDVYAKSGTSQQNRDAWFVGYLDGEKGPVTGVWVGNDNYSPTNNVVGGTYPAWIWKVFSKPFAEKLKKEIFLKSISKEDVQNKEKPLSIVNGN